jgi:fluoride exporter
VIEWRAVLAVAIGAAIGGVLRYVIGQVFLQRFGPGFPYGTLFINVTGSFAIGVIAQLALTRALGVSPLVRILLATGICGGYTTFSSFSLELFNLSESGLLLPLLYAFASVALGFGASVAGIVLVRVAQR